MRRLKNIQQNIVLLVLMALAVLSACAPEVAIPTEPPIDHVSMQLQWVTQAQFAGYYVALDKGWYKEAGIDLTIIPGAPDISAIDLVVSGHREFGTALLADLTLAVESKKPVISLAQIQQKNGLLLVSRKESGISSPEDFEEQRVGVLDGELGSSILGVNGTIRHRPD